MENEDNDLVDTEHTRHTFGYYARKLLFAVQSITVEPIMFLYMLAFMLTSVVEQAFFVDRACRVNLGYPDEICSEIEIHDEEKIQVQTLVSKFVQYNNIAAHVIPLVLAFFLGSWSDKNGGARKAPLLIGLFGKLYYSVMMVVISKNSTWPLFTVLYAATLPAAATGADLAIFMACFSYMADITTPEDRTVRITMLQVAYLVTIPLGVALGQMLFTATGESVPACFGVNASLVFIAFVYAAFRLMWRSAPQSPNDPPVRKVPLRMFCCDFFDYKHMRETARAIVRKRPGPRRAYLIAMIFAMALYTFQRDESSMMYLYTQLVFDWTTAQYSRFRTFQSSLYVVGCLLGLPFISKVLKLPDAGAILIGASAHAVARVLYILAKVPWLLYVGAVLGALGPVVAPVLKSMVSKVVPVRERGKVQAVLACADNAVPLFSGVIYTQTYNATINTMPGAIFLVTIASQLIVMSLVGGIQISLGKKPLDDGETPTHCDPAESKDIMAGDSNGDVPEPNSEDLQQSSGSDDSKQPVC